MVHRIVTHNTGRSRDLYGMLRLSRVSGDAAVVDILYLGQPYALGSPIPVIETGHEGCGEHTWHDGTTTFSVIPRNPGEVTFKAQVDPGPECCEGNGVPTVEARVTVTVMEVDLDIDTDRGGAITPGDDPGESTWSWGPSGAGAVVAPNVDDDDWAVGHTVLVDIDGTTPVLDTASDEGDLAQVIVRQADLPPDWHVWLTLVGDEKISVFDLGSGTAVLGHHAAGELLYQIPVGSVVAGDLEFGVEARGFVRGGSLLPTTKLVLTVYDEFFQEVCSDEVQLRVSPWLMLSNLDPADTVYVRKLPAGDPFAARSAQFVSDLAAALVGSGAALVIIDDPYYEGDVWVQDQIEIGFTSQDTGDSRMVVFNSPRDRDGFGANHGLRDFAERDLFRPDMGYVTAGADAGTQDSFGNLEVTPPVTVGGVAYPFGRIYTGSGMQSAIRSDFLWWQVVQAPFTLYTGWLYVEHVDEVVTFVPDLVAGNGAFKVLIADPTLGTSILQAEANPATTFIGKPGYEMTVAFALERYGTPNTTAYADEMASIKATLMLQLGLDENAFIHIPAFFEFPIPGAPLDPEYSESRSLLPNLVNVLVVNGRLIVAEPFYDGFKTDFVSRLSAIGYQDGTSVRFIDDWIVYHRSDGEIHCGTAVKRAPGNVAWWTQSVTP